MCDQTAISPYLRRPLRSYDQVLRGLHREADAGTPGERDAYRAGDQATPQHPKT